MASLPFFTIVFSYENTPVFPQRYERPPWRLLLNAVKNGKKPIAEIRRNGRTNKTPSKNSAQENIGSKRKTFLTLSLQIFLLKICAYCYIL